MFDVVLFWVFRIFEDDYILLFRYLYGIGEFVDENFIVWESVLIGIFILVE